MPSTTVRSGTVSLFVSWFERAVRFLKPTLTAILVGLLLMIWPALAKVQWEHFVDLFRGGN